MIIDLERDDERHWDIVIEWVLVKTIKGCIVDIETSIKIVSYSIVVTLTKPEHINTLEVAITKQINHTTIVNTIHSTKLASTKTTITILRITFWYQDNVTSTNN